MMNALLPGIISPVIQGMKGSLIFMFSLSDLELTDQITSKDPLKIISQSDPTHLIYIGQTRHKKRGLTFSSLE